ncbi:NUDIX hydrolase [Methylobacterium aquaticum]|uniref:NUDIX hydrolase n=1 Tax=Methylobacterium aquaticum TaxID=270351 RepID=UPI0019346E7B|nr:NUDIX domain-containing protein [Methylobacterium aquaticum]QRE75418.1 NUDIX domain-containing protein [Methylobacterium aquaticum]
MTVWRPEARIRFKALGLPWRGNRLLAAEVTDDDGTVKGVRPLGGGVAFGETARDAVIREFKEELGLDVETVGPPFFLESLYTHHGHLGHEIVALFEIRLPEGCLAEGCLADTDFIDFREDDGAPCRAAWFNIDALDRPGGPALYPAGLRDRLIRLR